MDFARGENGEYLVQRTGTAWEQVSPEEYEQFQKSFGQAAVGGFGDALQDSAGWHAEVGAGGGSDILSRSIGQVFNPVGAVLDRFGVNPAAEFGRMITEQNNERQTARDLANPSAQNLGQAAAIGAEMLIPTPPIVAGARAATASKTAAQATQQATEAQVRQIPIAPQTVGQRMTERVNGVLASNAARSVGSTVRRSLESFPGVGPVADDAIGAAGQRLRAAKGRNLSAAATESGERYLSKQMSVDELTDYAGPINIDPALQAKLMATNKGQFDEASDFVKIAENAERAEGGGPISDSIMSIRAQATETFMRRIGMDDVTRFPDKELLGDHLTDLNARIAANRAAVEPLDMAGFFDEVKAGAEASLFQTDNAVRAMDRLKSALAAYMDDAGRMTAEAGARLEAQLQDGLNAAARAGDIDTVEFLSSVKERLAKKFQDKMTPDQRAADREMLQQWVYTKNAVISPTAIGRGGINPKSMYGALTRKDNLARTGRRKDPFLKYLQSVETMVGDLQPVTGARLQTDLADIKRAVSGR